MKAEAAEEKPADDRQLDELSHSSRHDDPRLTGDPPGTAGRQLHPDDGQRAKDQDRDAGIYDGFQQGCFMSLEQPALPPAEGSSAQNCLRKIQPCLVLPSGFGISSRFARPHC
jgi:hypothetical protein